MRNCGVVSLSGHWKRLGLSEICLSDLGDDSGNRAYSGWGAFMKIRQCYDWVSS